MTERVVSATAAHEALYADICEVCLKHEKGGLKPEEMLAILSQVVGKLVAMQDPKTMSPERAMETVARNLEAGNMEMVAFAAAQQGKTS